SHQRAADRRTAAAAAGARAARRARRRRLRDGDRGADDMSVNRPFTRDQRMTIVNGMLAFVLMLVVLQLWLLTATMNAYLGGDESGIWPAARAGPGGPPAHAGVR